MFGVGLELVFIAITYFMFGWFASFDMLSLVTLLIIIISSPLAMDLDHKHAKLREWVTFIGLFIGMAGLLQHFFSLGESLPWLVFGMITACLGHLVFYISKHRGWTHTIPTTLLYGFILFYFLNSFPFTILGMVGFYSHLIADGIPFKVLP